MQRPRLARLIGALTAATALLLLAPACGGPTKSAADAALEKLPPYDAEAQSRFDDSIDPVMAGLAIDKPIYRGDLRLRDRSQAADFIVRAKLTTLTEERTESSRTFQLIFRPGDRIGGKETSPDPLEITVREGTPSFGMVINVKERLRGKTAIVLGKRFKQGNEMRVHAVVLADDPEVLTAVHENIALEELKK